MGKRFVSVESVTVEVSSLRDDFVFSRATGLVDVRINGRLYTNLTDRRVRSVLKRERDRLPAGDQRRTMFNLLLDEYGDEGVSD